MARPGRRKLTALAVILALSVVLNLAGIWWGLPQTGTWASDEIVPNQVYGAMSSLFSRGWYDKYPLFHFMVLTPFVLPVSVLYDTGVLRLPLAASNTLLLLLFRLVSVAMAAGLVSGIFRLARDLVGRRASLFAAALTAMIVPLPYYAKMANVDVPYLFWFVVSLFFLARVMKDGRRRDFILLGVTAALSVCTKDQAWALYILVPFLILWNDLKRSRIRQALASYGWGCAAAAGTFVAANNLIFNGSGFAAHLSLITGPASKDFAAFPANASGQIKLLGLAAKQVRFCLGWPILLVCLAGLALALLDKASPLLLKALPLMALSYHLFYTAVIRYSYDRFQLPAAILLAVFGGAALDRFVGAGRAKWKPALAAALLGFGLFQAVSVDRLMLADSRYGVERWMRTHISASAVVGTATDPRYLPRLEGYRVADVPLSLDEFRAVGKPEYIIFCTAFAKSFEPDSEGSRFFAGFASVPPGYRRVLDAKTDLALFPLSFEEIGTNLATIGPEIEIYARQDIPVPAAGSGRGR
jgi:hypothetical protein